MKGRTVATSITVCAAVLFTAMQSNHAAPATTAPSWKIGIVGMRDVFAGSKKYLQCQAQSAKRASQSRAQLAELAKQVDVEEGDLATIKQGTVEYIKQLQVSLEARSKLQSQQEILKQQRMFEDKKAFEDIYQEVLNAVEAIAKEKGLDLVLERTAPKFPMAGEEMVSTVSEVVPISVGGAVATPSGILRTLDLLGNTLFLIVIL